MKLIHLFISLLFVLTAKSAEDNTTAKNLTVEKKIELDITCPSLEIFSSNRLYQIGGGVLGAAYTGGMGGAVLGSLMPWLFYTGFFFAYVPYNLAQYLRHKFNWPHRENADEKENKKTESDKNINKKTENKENEIKTPNNNYSSNNN